MAKVDMMACKLGSKEGTLEGEVIQDLLSIRIPSRPVNVYLKV